jgi:hypothetical protein
MVTERVANELRAALNTLRGERESLDKQISDLEALLARMGAPVKRGPGRPPKASAPVAAPAPVKRGPGRPPKAAAAPAPAAETPVKRGPGRPKGSKNKPKRGPGRPPKAAAAPAPAPAAEGGASRRKPKWSAAAREAARARMKAYWAERKKSGSN